MRFFYWLLELGRGLVLRLRWRDGLRLTSRESYSVILFGRSCGSPFLIRYDWFVRVLKITATRKKHSWMILGLIMQYCCTYHHQLPSEVGLRGVSPPSLNFSNILQCVIVCPNCPTSFGWIILYLIRFGTPVNPKIHVRLCWKQWLSFHQILCT